MPKKPGKRNVAATAGGAKRAGAAGPKKSKLPEKIEEGTILTDLRDNWKIGSSIGTGGFGEIYSACRQGENNYEYAVKCEPHANGPLFVEMHFYVRHAKPDDIRKFQEEHGIQSLGMPYMLGTGSVDINGIKHRFIVMPRYGSDISKHFLSNGHKLPAGTCYRLALQMLHVYEFIHGRGYVHADLKAANIVLGYGPKQQHQAYLVDFGLASPYTTTDYKPNPKRMHNGTIEYTSRDAHLGVATMRADLEILGYNLIQWLGVELPWVRDKILNVPAKVQKAKEDFMSDVAGNMNKLFANTTTPSAVLEFMKYVAGMEYNETPNYEQCRKMFHNALKQMKFPTTGDLEFKLKDEESTTCNLPSTSKAITNQKVKVVQEKTAKKETGKVVKVKPSNKAGSLKTKVAFSVSSESESEDADDIINVCEDDDDNDIFEDKKTVKQKVVQRSFKTKNSPKVVKPTPRSTPKSSIRMSLRSSSTKSPPLPAKRPLLIGSLRTTPLTRKSPRGHTSGIATSKVWHTPLNTKTNTRMSSSISLSSSRSDVSMDANAISNVKRKKKPLHPTQEPRNSSLARCMPSGSKSVTPVPKIKKRKVASGTNDVDSARTAAVAVRKSRRFLQTPI